MAYNKFTHKNEVLLDLTQDDLTDDTSKVMQGFKYHGRDGVQYVGSGSGGEKPQLFAPIVTPALNKISWSNDSRNGGFPVSIIATLDDQTVTSPLTITEDFNGKVLTITASSNGFESVVKDVNLSWVNPEDLSVKFTRNTTIQSGSSYRPYAILSYYSYGGKSVYLGYGTADLADYFDAPSTMTVSDATNFIRLFAGSYDSTWEVTVNGVHKSYTVSKSTQAMWIPASDFNLSLNSPIVTVLISANIES